MKKKDPYWHVVICEEGRGPRGHTACGKKTGSIHKIGMPHGIDEPGAYWNIYGWDLSSIDLYFQKDGLTPRCPICLEAAQHELAIATLENKP